MGGSRLSSGSKLKWREGGAAAQQYTSRQRVTNRRGGCRSAAARDRDEYGKKVHGCSFANARADRDIEGKGGKGGGHSPAQLQEAKMTEALCRDLWEY